MSITAHGAPPTRLAQPRLTPVSARQFPLAGIQAKLHRARTHLRELEQLEAQFYQSGLWAVVDTIDPAPGWHACVARISRDAPLSLSVVAGEVPYQLRSSLDHLATAAARLVNSTARDVKFPIYQQRGDYEAKRRELGSRLRPEHWAIIDKHQCFDPLLVADLEPLIVGAKFNNAEKHEVVPPRCAVLPIAGFTGVAQVDWCKPDLITDGSVLCRYLPQPGEQVRGVVSLELAYGDLPWQVSRSGLDRLWWHTGEIVSEFHRATPEWAHTPDAFIQEG